MDRVVASAPLRIADAGGWTDTWFAGHGRVCSITAEPGVEVRASVGGPDGLVELSVPAFGDPYAFALGSPPGSHPLVEAAIRRWAPRGVGLRLEVRSHQPHGLGAGGSAALVVALVGAMRAVAGDALGPLEIARAAHEVETVELGWQSGVQDQLACAHGGATYLEVERYPHATVESLALSDATWAALQERLLTVSLGRPHRSTAVHEHVIAHLEHDPEADDLLEPLREAALAARYALLAGDLAAYGEALSANTDAQAALHPALVCDDARVVIDEARRAGALGWKVNGAGGNGGSVTVLAPDDPTALRTALTAIGAEILDLRPSRGGLVVRPA
jgi:D-glycero-alpha-D-manno-heptose-7-phosphate kinase